MSCFSFMHECLMSLQSTYRHSVIWCFERCDAIEICHGVTFTSCHKYNWVEIGYYSVAYFNCVTAWIKGGACTCCIDMSASTLPYEPLPLTEGLYYSTSNVVTQLKYNGIMFDFYPGLPHIYLSLLCFDTVIAKSCMWLLNMNLVQLDHSCM